MNRQLATPLCVRFVYSGRCSNAPKLPPARSSVAGARSPSDGSPTHSLASDTTTEVCAHTDTRPEGAHSQRALGVHSHAFAGATVQRAGEAANPQNPGVIFSPPQMQ